MEKIRKIYVFPFVIQVFNALIIALFIFTLKGHYKANRGFLEGEPNFVHLNYVGVW